MFGYVKIYKPELKIKHYEEYRGIYCSLCKLLGKRYGIFARLTLSYDFAFFAMVRMCSLPDRPCFKEGRCSFNPSKKCSFCTENTQELELTADIAMLTVYRKIEDNIEDDGFFRRFLMRLIKPLFRHYYKKARKYRGEADKIISQAMIKQRETELDCKGIDEAAHPTAYAMSELLCLERDGNTEKVLRRMGYYLGRWIYMADAFCDRREDEKKGSFNLFNRDGRSEDEIYAMLNMTAAELLNSYDLLEVRQFGDVINNILTDGLYHSVRKEEEKK